MDFERQLERIISKDQLHRHMNGLPDDLTEAKGFVIVEYTDKSGGRMNFCHEIGSTVTNPDLVYLCRRFEQWVLGN